MIVIGIILSLLFKLQAGLGSFFYETIEGVKSDKQGFVGPFRSWTKEALVVSLLSALAVFKRQV